MEIINSDFASKILHQILGFEKCKLKIKTECLIAYKTK